MDARVKPEHDDRRVRRGGEFSSTVMPAPEAGIHGLSSKKESGDAWPPVVRPASVPLWLIFLGLIRAVADEEMAGAGF
jgi:hypothetical protein